MFKWLQLGRRNRLAQLKRQRERTLTARKLRAAQTRALVALGDRAAIPHGMQRSKYLHKR